MGTVIVNKKKKWLASAFAVAPAALALFVSHVPAPLAQQPGRDAYGTRKFACGCFCGGTSPNYVVFADENCAGILAADACERDLPDIPREQMEGYCKKIKEREKIDSFKKSCPVFAPYCEPEKKENEPPPENTPPREPPSQGAAYPPTDPVEDGLGQGFGSLPPATRPPQRLVYLEPGSPGGDKPGTAFKVWLDRSACAIPMAENTQPSDPAAAKYVVQGRVVRNANRVRIEAEAQGLASDTGLGKVNSEVQGEDATAVATATRLAAKKLKLLCTR